jgi:uncharacterized small protein (DUF1192 family)
VSFFDEDAPKKTSEGQIMVGQDLTTLSEKDLEERIEALQQEIERTKETLSARSNIRSAAESLFGKQS